MKRNLLLIVGLMVGVLLIVNNTKRLLTFRSTSLKVEEAQMRLEKIRAENEALKGDLEYKKSDEFAEKEIRDKLGLAKEGETVVILPKEENSEQGPMASGEKIPNYSKWWNIFFGG